MVLIVDAAFLFLLAFFELLIYRIFVPVNFVYPVLLCASMVSELFSPHQCSGQQQALV